MTVFLAVVDDEVARPADAHLAHLPGHERRVRRNAAARREDALGGDHAAQVFGRRFHAHQHDLFAPVGHLDGFLRVEHDLAARRTRTGGQPLADDLRALGGRAVEDRRENLAEAIGGDALDGVLLGNALLLHHLDGDADGGHAGALAVAGLEDVEAVVLDGELQVLHVAEMVFQRVADLEQLLVADGHFLAQLRDGLRRADAGHHVLALGIDEVFPVKHFSRPWPGRA